MSPTAATTSSPLDARYPEGASGVVMPDIARDAPAAANGRLDRVGMSNIEVGVRLRDPSGQSSLVPARADAFVDLADPTAKGIHMSRLFLSLQAILAEEELSFAVVERLLRAFVGSHADISSSAAVRIVVEQMTLRPALVSANQGWRVYPVAYTGQISQGAGAQAKVSLGMEVQVAYSSTCPCSAALARQIIQDKFASDFAAQGRVSVEQVAAWLGREQSILATPHSQRSHAEVQVTLADGAAATISPLDLINQIEVALQTAVQAAVKREDEQEFARLNGRNLMFCEDAARRMRAVLDADKRYADYRILARHIESLHPHDAVSIVTKGVPGGLRA